MNFKIFLLSVLLLKSCEFGESFDNPIEYGSRANPPHAGFIFSNLMQKDVYVWYESIYGDQRHEIGDIVPVSFNSASIIHIASGCYSIHWMMMEERLRNRLDTLFVYVSDSTNGYFQWRSEKDSLFYFSENTESQIFQYTIVKSNINYVLGADELVPICFTGF